MTTLSDDIELLWILCVMGVVFMLDHFRRWLAWRLKQPRSPPGMPFKAPGRPVAPTKAIKGPGSRLVYLGHAMGPSMPYGSHVTLIDPNPDMDALGVPPKDRGVQWFQVRTERGLDFLARADLCR